MALNIMNQQMPARRIGTTLVNAVVYVVVNTVVTATRLYSVLHKLTFLAVIVAWMIFNYHQINCSSLATGTQQMFAMKFANLQIIAFLAANVA